VKRIKGIIYGVGEMGKLMTRLMVEKGVDIVGAIGHVANVGRDLGEVAGLGYSLNVKITNNADAILSQREADIVVMSFCSDMETMYGPAKKCIENGMNVISITEEALYPWTASSELASKLDKLAKKHGVTITGGGIQDLIWVNLISVLTGGSHTIESVLGQATCNADDYGAVVPGEFLIGETKDEFYRKIKEQAAKENPVSPFAISLEALVADLGLTIKKKEQSVKPIIAEEDVESKALSKIVKRGEVVGVVQIAEINTEQGIRFRTEFIIKIYQKGESDTNRWFIKGYPDIYLENEKLPGRVATCTLTVNRIPDIINSEPGFVTVEKLPKLKFKAFPLHYYLKK